MAFLASGAPAPSEAQKAAQGSLMEELVCKIGAAPPTAMYRSTCHVSTKATSPPKPLWDVTAVAEIRESVGTAAAGGTVDSHASRVAARRRERSESRSFEKDIESCLLNAHMPGIAEALAPAPARAPAPPPAPTAVAELPDGWQQLADEDGDRYYVRPDGGTQWEWPDRAAAAQQAAWSQAEAQRKEAEEQRKEAEAQAEVRRFEERLRLEEAAEKVRQADQKAAAERLQRERDELYEAARAMATAEQASIVVERDARAVEAAKAVCDFEQARREHAEARREQREQARREEWTALQSRRLQTPTDEATLQRQERESRLQGRQGCVGLLVALRAAYGSAEAAGAEPVVSAALAFVQAQRTRSIAELARFKLVEPLVAALPGLQGDAAAAERLREALRKGAAAHAEQPARAPFNPSMAIGSPTVW